MTRIFLLPSAAFLGEFEIIALFNQKIAFGNFQNPRHPRHPRSKKTASPAFQTRVPNPEFEAISFTYLHKKGFMPKVEQQSIIAI